MFHTVVEEWRICRLQQSCGVFCCWFSFLCLVEGTLQQQSECSEEQSSNSDSFSHEESVTASFLKKRINLLQNKSFLCANYIKLCSWDRGLKKTSLPISQRIHRSKSRAWIDKLLGCNVYITRILWEHYRRLHRWTVHNVTESLEAAYTRPKKIFPYQKKCRVHECFKEQLF